jgi:septal ring factor EnvC (AmiA/AmiB activator)
MQKDTIEDLFERLSGEFDINEPNEDHKLRFLDKLKANKMTSLDTIKSSGFNWKPYLAIAASLVICFSVFMTAQNEPEVLDLASVSPELSETQDFFTVTIENELKKLNNERSPLTEQIIDDALKQIETLETDYQNLKTDLTESGNDQRVIYAMISNFQNRIDILNTVLKQIETIKELKTNKNEPNNTI